MKHSAEALYLQLGALIAEMPDLKAYPAPPEVATWLGRAVALVDAGDNIMDSAALVTAIQFMGSMNREPQADQVVILVHRALARAELSAPASVAGAFIATGAGFDAIAVIGKIMALARQEVLLVDPYADWNILCDYAVLAPQGVRVRILTDERTSKPGLGPAAVKWVSQYGSMRPLEVRATTAKAIHDRLIAIDGTVSYSLGQSFNALATRASTTLLRADSETAALKIAAHETLWVSAKALT